MTGTPSAEANPSIYDQNRAPIDLYLSSSHIFEGSISGMIVGYLVANDPDANQSFTFSIVNDADGKFALKGAHLCLKEGASVDYETKDSHTVTLRVTDQNGLSFDKDFTIQVLDLKEDDMSATLQAPTDIALTYNAVHENSVAGTLVGYLNAADADGADVFTYSLLDSAQGRFRLSDDGKALVVADGAKLDYEAASSHMIKVRVTDAAGYSYDKTFVINVKDVNEAPVNSAPTDIVMSNVTVSENSMAGTLVGRLSAIDPDAGDHFTYALLDSAEGRFQLTAGDVLVVANGAVLDYEAASAHTIKVRVTDAAGLSYTKTLTINVTDVVDAGNGGTIPPGMIELSNSTVVENSAGGTVVGTFNPVGPDSGKLFTYSLENDASGCFALVGNQLVVKPGAAIDFEAASSHSITLRSVNEAGYSYTKVFTINVLDVSEEPSGHAPVDILLSQDTVQENSATDTVIGFLTGVDPDGDILSYTLLDSAEGRFRLSDDGRSLVVADGSKLDYEAATGHTIKVRVMDATGQSYDKSFTIKVADVVEGGGEEPGNHAPTGVVLSTPRVQENAEAGTAIGTIRGIDPDAGETFTYTLLDDADGRFKIVGDQVVVADGSKLDYETLARHDIKVRITDSHGATLDVVLPIYVVDVMEDGGEGPGNSAPTDISLSNSSVNENSALGTVVGVLAATDPDAGEEFTYELIGGADAHFKIVGNQLVVAGALDYEAASSYGVQIRVRDKAGNVFDKVFTIDVKDVVESGEGSGGHAPTDIDFTGSLVSEHAAAGLVIGGLAAVDPDLGDTLTFSLVDDAGGRFKIVDSHIVVADGATFDYETATEHTIKVRVTDSTGRSYEEVFVISVGDEVEGGEEPEENHAPEDLTISSSTIRENSAYGSVVGILATFDEDESETFTYQLLDSAGGRFKLSGSKIVVADGSKLDYEVDRSHTIKVRVTDSDGLSLTKEIVISVADVVAEIVKGSSASNTLIGGRGNDKLYGGLGNDILKGGLGRDTFVFNTKLNSKANVDKLVGFSSKDDAIHLSKAIFSKIGSGTLKSSDFVIGKAAKDSKDRIIYDKAAGAVYYDKDGKGGAAQVKFATVEKGIFLTASDFFIV